MHSHNKILLGINLVEPCVLRIPGDFSRYNNRRPNSEIVFCQNCSVSYCNEFFFGYFNLVQSQNIHFNELKQENIYCDLRKNKIKWNRHLQPTTVYQLKSLSSEESSSTGMSGDFSKARMSLVSARFWCACVCLLIFVSLMTGSLESISRLKMS